MTSIANEDFAKRLVIECRVLELDAYDFHAQRHWHSGRKHAPLRRWGHVVLILLNALGASTLLALLKGIGGSDGIYVWGSAVLALSSAIVSALMLKFQPDENLRGHAAVAAQFARIARKSRFLAHKIETGESTVSLGWESLQKLCDEFYQVREQAAAFVVGETISARYSALVEAKRNQLMQSLSQ